MATQNNEEARDGQRAVSRDAETHSGALVFADTRVPVATLIAYLKAGHSVDDFLEGFPSVERWQVEVFLDVSAEAVGHLRPGAAPA